MQATEIIDIMIREACHIMAAEVRFKDRCLVHDPLYSNTRTEEIVMSIWDITGLASHAIKRRKRHQMVVGAVQIEE